MDVKNANKLVDTFGQKIFTFVSEKPEEIPGKVS